MCAMFQDVVDGIEFARGDPKTTWGSVRAAMGHPEPFPLYYISVGNQECSKPYYKGFVLSCLTSSEALVYVFYTDEPCACLIL